MLYPVKLIASIALALLLLLGGFGLESEADYVARKLATDLPEPLSVTYGDSHGGFHGDGLLHIELTFDLEDRAAVEEAVSSHPSGYWNPFPMDELMEEVVYLRQLCRHGKLARAGKRLVVPAGSSGGRRGRHAHAALL